MRYISAEQLAQELQKNTEIVLLDIREKYEYEVCNIHSIHIPMHEIPQKAATLNSDARTVIVCRTGNRASAVANFLEANFGFKNIEVLEGGIVAYAEKVDHELDTEY
jgi:adenylyltransferase/sulfurtransferase